MTARRLDQSNSLQNRNSSQSLQLPGEAFLLNLEIFFFSSFSTAVPLKHFNMATSGSVKRLADITRLCVCEIWLARLSSLDARRGAIRNQL